MVKEYFDKIKELELLAQELEKKCGHPVTIHYRERRPGTGDYIGKMVVSKIEIHSNENMVGL